MTHIVWFRNDLRSADNPALHHACQQQQAVIAVVYNCDRQWQQHGLGSRKIQLYKNRILTLRQQLQKLNIPLLILTAETFSDCTESLQQLCQAVDAQAVNINIEYEVNERQRDAEFSRWAEQQYITLNTFHDQCIIQPGAVLTRNGQPFKVFSPFKRTWISLAETRLPPPLPEPKKRTPLSTDYQQIIHDIQKHHPLPVARNDSLWPTSEKHAHQKLNDFAGQQMAAYQQLRDIPFANATSRLSFELSLGILSPRQCLHTATQINDGRLSGGKPGVDSWINELIWREFYRHLMVAFPVLCKHQAFKAETEHIEWRNDNAGFLAWCDGRTGYPIIDAAMRQLKNQGWMHNRLRMITAMFLSKHLLIDWRRGEAFFNHWLVDADLASNNGGWQWSASTGADGVPYFRVFNPIRQSERFDSQTDFIIHFLPELTPLSPGDRHFPSLQQRQACDYPAALVEHKFARQRAIDTFRKASQKDAGQKG